MKHFLVAFFIILASCSPLGLLTGGGPNVAANVQAGKENVQQAVANQIKKEAGRDIVEQQAPVVAENIKEVNIQQTPLWIIILLVLGWLLPSPNEIARWIRGLFGWTT